MLTLKDVTFVLVDQHSLGYVLLQIYAKTSNVQMMPHAIIKECAMWLLEYVIANLIGLERIVL